MVGVLEEKETVGIPCGMGVMLEVIDGERRGSTHLM